MPGMTWDADSARSLLLAVLKVSDVKIDFEQVAAELSNGERTCTARAVQEQMKKLRKQALEDGTEKDGSPKPKTPAKRKTAAGEDGTPSKKAKGGKAKVKTEIPEEDRPED